MKYNWSFQGENMKKSGASQDQSASELISQRIAELVDWRGETLSRMRTLIKKADPDAVEEWKWMGTPVWSHDGIICTGESYKKVVKRSTKEKKSTSRPSRRWFAKRSPSTVRTSRNLRRKRSPKQPLSLYASASIPSKCGGRPCIRDMRIRVIDVLALLAAGESLQQILDKLSVAGFG